MKLIGENILSSRRPSIDVYRGIAILFVVFFHFDDLFKLGFIGVDLFFIISGFLVSRTFLHNLKDGQNISWKSFALKRITKIIPSYYFFLIVGTIFARIFLLENHSDQVISLSEFPKYLLFYMNYDLVFQWSFELAWSLCVEEHFYIFLPLLFLSITFFVVKQNREKWLMYSLLVGVLSVWVLKFVGYYNGWELYYASHMRIDAMLLGVLISFQEINLNKLKQNSPYILILGLGIILTAGILFYTTDFDLFEKVILHILFAIGFYLIIKSSLHYTFKVFKFLRVMAYFSYNWYLWHALTSYVILNLIDLPYSVSLFLYLTISFTIAVITTKFIEEPLIRMRKYLIKTSKTSIDK